MIRVLLFGVVMMSGNCIMSPRRNTVPTYSTANTTTGTVTNPGGSSIGDPLSGLNQADQLLQRQGYTRLGPAVHNGSMPERGLIAYALDANAGACYAVLATATANTDLNIVVTDPVGSTVAYNVNPDANPWGAFCATQTGRYVVRVEMARGAGEYYYAAYQGPAASRADLTSVLGGQTQQTSVATQDVTMDAATQQRLNALDAQLSSERFQRVSGPYGLNLRQQEDRNFELNLEQGNCYAFATLGGAGARDTDAYLVDGTGNELARGNGDIDSLVRFCAPQTGSYKMRARMYAGNGALFAVGYLQQRAEAPTPPNPTTAMSGQTTAGIGLDENYRLLDSDMHARGYENYGSTTRGELNEGETREFDIQLEGGKCYAILTVGDQGIRDLDLMLLSNGRELDRNVESDARPIVRVCAKNSGDFKMRVRMVNGRGNFVYSAYRWPRGTRGPFGLSGLMYVRLAEVTSLLSVEGYQPAAAFEPGKGNLPRVGQDHKHALRFPAGQCFAIVVVGGEGVDDLDLTLSRGASVVAQDGTRNAFPNVRFCSERAAGYDLKVKATTGEGAYFYQVFSRASGG